MTKTPALIFLIDGLDVSAYASLEDVAFDVEPVDAKDHEFLICDAEGRLVQLSTDRGFVTASLAEAEPTHAAELETALRKFLGAMNEPLAADATCDLVCLVLTCHKFVKVTRRPKNIFSEVWRGEGMKIESLGEIIAERRVYLQAQGAERREIIVRVGKPQPFPDLQEDFYVPYELVGVKRDTLHYAAGVDAVQALQLVMVMIGADLHAIARARQATISWVAGREGDSGFPTTLKLDN